MIRILGTVFAALFGLAFGSFLNVCLYRWPRELSITAPRSYCPHCHRQLLWWENIPLASWIALRGRCRTCHAWIGWRYPLVELAVGALWTVQVWQFLGSAFDPDLPTVDLYNNFASTICKMVLFWLLVALAVLDAENLWLPDWITLPGTALGFIAMLLRAKLNSDAILSYYGATNVQLRLLAQFTFNLFFGILAAAALILLIRWVYWLIRRREGIGLGDAKLMAMLAAWLGLPGALLAFALGVVLGALTALVSLANRRDGKQPGSWALQKLPLGTFLCIGGIASSLWGERILAAYLIWAGF